MPRWYLFLSAIVVPALAFACNDDTIQDVDPDVCVSGLQWIGGKRGSPEMFPGRDCVGCHLENDGPELMLGGTIYSYVEQTYTPEALDKYKQRQTGEDCFGKEGVNLVITGADLQEFRVTSNRAGNFYIEGKATDLAKPFRVKIDNYLNEETGLLESPPMGTPPFYGGCARCHTPGVEAKLVDLENGDTDDLLVRPAGSVIGLPSTNLDEALQRAQQ
jgi:hypothetical protein